MRIQLISESNLFEYEDNKTYSPYDKIISFKEFDVNIIDLSPSLLWKCDESREDIEFDLSDIFDDLKQKYECSENICFLLLPHTNYNTTYTYDYSQSYIKLKEILKPINIKINKTFNLDSYSLLLDYETSHVDMFGKEYRVDFVFNDTLVSACLQKSRGGNCMFCKLRKNLYATTINFQDGSTLMEAIKMTLSSHSKSPAPEWFENICYFDDEELLLTKETIDKEIQEKNEKLQKIKAQINKNNELKSITYTNGEELVQVVTDIFKDIFSITSDDFNDIKREDFRFAYKDTTFTLEIKGIKSNVKNNNIAQCKKHVTDIVSQDETINPQNLKGLLVVNSQKNTDVEDRTPIHKDQIDYAKNEKVLIITTIELLKLYDKFLTNKSIVDKIYETFKMDSGEFKCDKRFN